jgi:hypothetical protein
MKGLIIKDIMCLRKQLTVFGFVVAGVLAVGIMYVLSARFGNIATANAKVIAENQMDVFENNNIATLALALFMLVPLASVGDLLNIFVADRQAGFEKVAGILPLSVGKRLTARFITIFTLFGIGAVIDIIIAFILSVMTDIISFSDFVGIIISASSFMCIYSALVILFCILMGKGRETVAQILSLLSIVLIYVIIRFKKLKDIMTAIIVLDKTGESGMTADYFWNFISFIKQKSYILLITALIIMAVSYCISYVIAEKKRGVI